MPRWRPPPNPGPSAHAAAPAPADAAGGGELLSAPFAGVAYGGLATSYYRTVFYTRTRSTLGGIRD
jgi:hypothetical protein